MSLDEETDGMIREISHLTGEAPQDIVLAALKEKLARERLKQRNRTFDRAAIDEIVKRFAALPVLDPRTDDEILGYDENGLPT